MGKNKRFPLDQEINNMLASMATMNASTKEYGLMVENLKKLSETKIALHTEDKNSTRIPNRSKKQREFSQRIVWFTFIFSMAIVLIVLASHILLTVFGFEGLSQEFITVVTVYGAITSGLSFTAYAVLQAWRSGTENKWCGGDRTTYNQLKELDSEPKG